MHRCKKQGLLFDLDDTLITTTSTILARLTFLAQKYQIKEGPMYLHNLLYTSNREQELAKNYPSLSQLWEDYESLRLRMRPHLFPGVREGLQKLLTLETPLGLFTRAPTLKVHEFLDYNGFKAEDFTLGFFGDTNGPYPKIDAGSLLKIKEKLDSSFTFIGDDLADLYSAQRASVPFIGVCTGLTNRQLFRQAGLQNERIFNCIKEVFDEATLL